MKSWLAEGLKVALEYACESLKRASTTTEIPSRRYPSHYLLLSCLSPLSFVSLAKLKRRTPMVMMMAMKILCFPSLRCL